ncbi:MAG: helix-turn-helix transcriptional regulator [Bifidobacterium sp.]|uniref:PadR family transcriptional regulator n=2 Tax=Bifidobacterium sp. TaxID=41200 RepID=UPI0039EB9C3A
MNGPVFAHGQMRLYLLTLLDESPKHGYELIQAIEQRFAGAYVPSAGTVYPRLAKLTEEGLIARTEEGRKTVYSITDAGRAELARRKDDTAELECDIESSVRRLADELRSDMRRSMSSLRDDLDAAMNSTTNPRADGASTGPFASRAGFARARESSKFMHATSDERIRKAEELLQSFRQDIRSDLRTADANGALTEHTLDMLAEQLRQVRERIDDSIKSQNRRRR